MVQDARKFLISSDYPMDMIVWSHSGEKTVQPSTYTTVTIPHGLPFKPLFFGLFSVDGGSTWVSLDTEIPGTGGASLFPLANSTNIEIEIHSRAGTTSVMYKLWAYAPSNSDAQVQIPVTQNNFRINSDVDYLKLAKADIWQATSGEGTLIYEHNFGYKPWVIMWFEYADGTIQLPLFVYSSNTATKANRYVVVDNNSIRAYFTTLAISSDAQLEKIHYRVYADEIGGLDV